MTVPLPIGRAVLDVAARTLAGPDRTVRLTPQPLRVLLCLARRHGRVVAWDTAVSALADRYGRANAQLVQAHLPLVRRALRDSGSGAVIETVYAVGVRLGLPAADEAGAGAQATGEARTGEAA